MKKIFFIIALGFTLLVLSKLIIFSDGSPFSYDWDWPFFSVGNFWRELWNRTGAPFDFISINAGVALALLGTISILPSVAFKVFILLIHLLSASGFYLFIDKRVKSELTKLVASITYSFTPYIFIRTILGYRWSLISYAALPFFLHLYLDGADTLKKRIILILLLALIFSQVQAGVLVTILLVFLIIFSEKESRVARLKNFSITYLGFALITLPWFVRSLKSKLNLLSISENSVTTLQYIEMLPHRFRNLAILADHQITDDYFTFLTKSSAILLGIGVFYLVAFTGIFFKKNRNLILAFLFSAILLLPFTKGPSGVFGPIFTFFFNHFPPVRLFRETYHIQFIFSIILVTFFAFGLDIVIRSVNRIKTKILPIFLISLTAGSSLFIIMPYLSFDYGGYLNTYKPGQEYQELYRYLKENSNSCSKVYYPPGMGFVYPKGIKNYKDASNSDMIARSLGVPILDDGLTYSFLPTDERFLRNEIVSQFYERNDNGEFTALLNEADVDCVILRNDLETKYDIASNLWRDRDSSVRKKWNNPELKELLDSKKDLKIEKQFGNTVFLYKPEVQPKEKSEELNNKLNLVGKKTIEQFNNRTIESIPLSDSATQYAYYIDGWSRGRYDFWRKHIFSELRQDFIYTGKTGAVLNVDFSKKGDWMLWARSLDGGTGSVEIKVDGKSFILNHLPGSERFSWKSIAPLSLNERTKLEIKNIIGENAIADLILVSP